MAWHHGRDRGLLRVAGIRRTLCATGSFRGSLVRARHSPSIAAALSFLVPGLGQLWLGAARRAVVVAAPAIVVAVVALAGAVQAGDTSITDVLLDPATLPFLLVANVALLVYHSAAMVDAWLLGRRRAAVVAPGATDAAPRSGRGGLLVLVVLLAATFVLHGSIEYVSFDANATLDAIFSTSGGDSQGEAVIPEASFADEAAGEPGAPVSSAALGESGSAGASIEPTESATTEPSASVEPSTVASPTARAAATPSAVPSATPAPASGPAWARDGRLNLLLVGADAGPDRWSLRTDTMILLSVSVKTGRAALFGIPRNLIGVPLAPESAGAFAKGRFPGMLNALYVYAMGHSKLFPGGANRGYRAVAGAVQELVGVPLDGMVVVNLAGFVQLVDELGGLWIDVPYRLQDDQYPLEDGSKLIKIDFLPGCQHLDGRMALAYARSRHQDSDYGRMHRQQDVLLALRRQVDPVKLVPRVPDLLRIARDNLWTTLKRADIKGLAKLASRVDVRRIRTVFFTPHAYPERLDTATIARIRSVVRGALDGPLPPQAALPDGKACR